MYDYEGFLLHYAARHYACGPGQSCHITDISKGAMPVKAANVARTERHDRWFPLLADELRLVDRSAARTLDLGGWRRRTHSWWRNHHDGWWWWRRRRREFLKQKGGDNTGPVLDGLPD